MSQDDLSQCKTMTSPSLGKKKKKTGEGESDSFTPTVGEAAGGT